MAGIRKLLLVLVGCASLLVTSSNLRAQGIILPAGGAVNRGMGGATTGTAIEAIGSMYWNPATINRFERDQLAFSFEAIYANSEVSSTFPGAGSGSSDGEIGAVPVPTLAWVYQTANPDLTLGLGIFGVGGFSTNYQADANNPILTPPFAQGGVGLGGVKSDAMFFEIVPAGSLQLTDRLSVAAGPIIGLGKITLDDNMFVGLNADGTYPRGDGTRYHWGIGAQLGIHYVHNCCWEFGANIKSPVWFEPFRYFSEDANGLGRLDEVDVTLPMIVSGGLAYRGIQYTVLTLDVRYYDYTSTEGFGDSATYKPNGAVSGLGWNDLFTLGLGAQVRLTQCLTGRVGYIYSSELFDEQDTFFNIGSELSYRHVPTVGATYDLNEHTSVSIGYQYVAQWDSTGPYVLPGIGAVPGSSITSEFSGHILTVGVNVGY
jgi:long-chain fatty acid transport protein